MSDRSVGPLRNMRGRHSAQVWPGAPLEGDRSAAADRRGPSGPVPVDRTETDITITAGTSSHIPIAELDDQEFTRIVYAAVDGTATPEERALLEANRPRWELTLFHLLDDIDDRIETVREKTRGFEKAMALADLEGEWRAVDEALTVLIGPPADTRPAKGKSRAAAPAPLPSVPSLQLSWEAGHVVAWAGAHQAAPLGHEDILELLTAAGAPKPGWEEHKTLKLPVGGKAPALTAPTGAVLGWLVAMGAAPDGIPGGPSVRWMGHAAVAAASLVAQGRVVPQLKRVKKGKGEISTFGVHWVPALVDDHRIKVLADALPGTVALLATGGVVNDPRSVTRTVITDMVDAICRSGAQRLEVPAAPPEVRGRSDVAETILARLDGTPFEAPSRYAVEMSRRLEQWARPVTSPGKSRLVVELDPPDSSEAWLLKVLVAGADNTLQPVNTALIDASNRRRKDVQDHLTRLERLLPVLLRPGGERRGEVIVSQDEAWELMTRTGKSLESAGFEVRVPRLSRRRTTPALRMTADAAEETVVGAQQLASVRWSAVFDDVELDAAEIAELARQARPMVRSRGQWVELDRADLVEAAAALAERADKTRLTGAEMLRHALGLEGSPLGGGISVAGGGWAVDLIRSASKVTGEVELKPEGFEGELRHYQGEALGWLGFIDDAGLGGCLALDMGLGKTPTLLAHLRRSRTEQPDLVIAPPAVVGNWAAEAARFTPDTRIVVHHGPRRASAEEFPTVAAEADLVITTYGTAVRDVDALSRVEWNRVALDEAQVIKNHLSETSRQLRKVGARSRLALTGTPIENGLGDLWAIMDFTNPGLVGPRTAFISQLSSEGTGKAAAESALKALNGILVFRRTKAEPSIAAELPDRIDQLDHCTMTSEQIGLYQAVLDELVVAEADQTTERKGQILAAITALKQICNHPAAYKPDDEPLDGRSGKLARLNEIVDSVFAAEEKVLIFTHFARWGDRLAEYLTERTGRTISCYHGGLARGARDRMIREFQEGEGAGALVLSLKAGGTGLNLTAANHVVLYDRWWNPAVEDQARDRAWRIGQEKTVISHRLVCPGTVDERVEEVVAGKRKIADMVLPKSSSLGDLDAGQLQAALGLDPDLVMTEAPEDTAPGTEPEGNDT